MKNHALRIFAVLGLVVLLATPAAFAQMTANIPFDFTVCSKTLPAGQYEIAPTSSLNVLRIRHEEGRAVELVAPLYSTARGSTAQPRLVFHRCGNQYFLSQIWGAAPGSMSELRTSKAEKAMTANSAKPGTTTIAAARRP
jgi:hypothetical protein